MNVNVGGNGGEDKSKKRSNRHVALVLYCCCLLKGSVLLACLLPSKQWKQYNASPCGKERGDHQQKN